MTPKTQRTVAVGGASLVAAAPALLLFLGLWEGRAQYTVYPDKLAQNIPTVCKGLTRHVTSTPIIIGEVWDKEKCDAEEVAALVRVQTALGKCFKIPPPQGVFDMASSHAWNNGAPNTCSSLAMEAFNRGEWLLGCQRLSRSDEGRPVWSYTRTGRVLPNGKPEMVFRQGLANRRSAETELCKKAQ